MLITMRGEMQSLKEEAEQMNSLNRRLIDKLDDFEMSELTLKEDSRLFKLIDGIENILGDFKENADQNEGVARSPKRFLMRLVESIETFVFSEVHRIRERFKV